MKNVYNYYESKESIESRLEIASVAQKRTRNAMLLLLLVSCMVFLAVYNAYLSYDYNYIEEMNISLEEHPEYSQIYKSLKVQYKNMDSLALDSMRNNIIKSLVDTSDFYKYSNVPNELKRNALRTWNESRYLNISFLGIRIGAEDAPLLGSFAITILAAWFYLCAKRENSVIGFLLYNTSSAPDEGIKKENISTIINPIISSNNTVKYFQIQWWIFNSINSNSLFFNIPKLKKPIKSFNEKEIEKLVDKTFSHGKSGFNRLFEDPIRYFFIYISLILVTLCVVIDLLATHWLPDPYNYWNSNDGGYSIDDFKLVISLVFLYFHFIFIMKANRNIKSTEFIVFEYYKILESSKNKILSY